MNTPDTEVKCCNKCLMNRGFSGFPYCVNAKCECHTPDTEWEKRIDYLLRHQEDCVIFDEIKREINYLLTSRDTYWKERVRKVRSDTLKEAEEQLNLASMIDVCGDGMVSVKMGMSQIKGVLRALDNLK